MSNNISNSTAKPPNIILIVCDQMRGDCLGIDGHPDVKTPYLDSIAAEGTRFEHAYTACPSCIPARAALLTGQSQKRHGRVGYEDGVPWRYKNTLPALLSRHGYHTEAIGKMHTHPPLNRCGFNGLTLHDGYVGYYRRPEIPWIQHQFSHDSYLAFLKDRHGFNADVADTGVECNSWVARPWIYDEMSHPTNWTVTKGIEFLQYRDRGLPFFLKLSFVRPHPPWDAPAPYFDMYANRDLRPPVMGGWASQRQSHIYNAVFGTSDPALQKQGLQGYYACITHMDHQIGRFINALEREGVLENSLIIFTSDHGEMLFDHGLFRKVNPYQGSVRIPLLVRPGKGLRQGAVQPVSPCLGELRDIAPTILDWAGVDAPPEMDGMSLLPLMYDKGAKGREYIHGEHSGGDLSNHYIVTARDKFIWFSQSGKAQYFDLQADPRETCDRIFDPAAARRIDEMRRLLIGELIDREERYTDGTDLIAGKTPLRVLSHMKNML